MLQNIASISPFTHSFNGYSISLTRPVIAAPNPLTGIAEDGMWVFQGLCIGIVVALISNQIKL